MNVLNSDENVPGPSTLDDVSLGGGYKENLYFNSAIARREEDRERGTFCVLFRQFSAEVIWKALLYKIFSVTNL